MTTLMFHKRFVGPILSGRKTHTIRRNRKREIPVGDLLSLRHWEGQGYRSPQVEFFIGVCVDVLAIHVEKDMVAIGGGAGFPLGWATVGDLGDFARSDGFSDWPDMMDYYRCEKIALPFEGVLIEWRPGNQ